MSKEALTPLARGDLPTSPRALARYLIGATLVRSTGRKIITVRIVETEAYVSGDPAGHGFNGLTKRNAALFAERGHAYIYRIYGLYWCLNVSAGKPGEGVGVLIRAGEPLSGLEAVQGGTRAASAKNLLRGPGRLCVALAIDGSLDGIDLTERGPLWLGDRHRPRAIGTGVRIGLSKAEDKVLRFYERGSAYLSGSKRLNS